MLKRFAKSVRLFLGLAVLFLSGCSLLSPKPEVIDTQEGILAPISPELQQAFGEALVLLQDEEFLAAEALLLDITQQFPQYAGPWSNLAIAKSKLEKFDEALESINNALKQNEQFCQALSLKGVILRELGQFKLAKEQYLAALACDPNDLMTLYNLGVLSDLYLHDNVTALSYYQQYLVALGEQQDETVKSWVVDLKRRVPVESQQNSVDKVDRAADDTMPVPQLAGEE